MSTAIEFLNNILTTEKIEGAAAVSHNEGWFAAKQRDAGDPNNPFQGYGPERRRVRDLSADERAQLGIADDANPSADVYHPLYMPFADLDDDTKGKNVFPLACVCYVVGDFLIDEDDTLEDLADVLDGLIDGSDVKGIRTVARVTHAAFQSQEIRVGSRPYGDNARDDFPLWRSLDKGVAELDGYTTLPAARWLREQLSKQS